ncbi:hypothetical protein PQR46_36485 [Paraburkholderia sediminicola]|uniref:hypothetical protein n=1 Tax=Paraburkholderia TaxID=1822464 RepID=UPI0038B8798C
MASEGSSAAQALIPYRVSNGRFLQALDDEVERRALRPRSAFIAAISFCQIRQRTIVSSPAQRDCATRVKKTVSLFVLPTYAVFRRT